MAAKKRVNEDEDKDISIRPMHNSAEKKLAVPDDLEKPPPDDRSTVFTEKQQGSWPNNIEKKLSLLLIACALIIIALLVNLNIKSVFEPPLVLPLMNTLFLGIIPIIIAYISLRVYTKSGSVNVFLMGSGVLIFGLGSIVAGWVNPLPGGPNMTVTIHNTCAFIGSIIILAGAVISRIPTKYGGGTGRTGIITAAYAGIVIFVTLFCLATLQGMIPPFFVPGSGPTVLRQIILENATVFFLLSSVLFMLTYRKERSDFFFWYSIAFALLAVGLLAVFFQPSVGSLIGWVGRSAQYLGFVFALYAILLAWKAAMVKGIPIERVITNFFVDAEQSYKQLVETATDAIVTFDENYRVLLWNARAEKMFGYMRDEAIGSSFPELAIDDRYIAIIKTSNENIPDNHARLLESVEITGKHKDGSHFPVEMTLSRRRQDGRLIQTCILRDITERKKTDEALRETNEYLNNLFDYANAPIIVWNPAFVITRFNHAFEDLTLISEQEVIGQRLDILFPKESRDASLLKIKKTIEGERWETVEIPILVKDGSVRIVLWNSANILDPDGRIISTIAQGIDITDRKLAEDALRQANKKLNLLSGITRHDINNQLLVLNGFLGFLQQKVTDPTLEDYFTKITNASTRIAAMIRFTKEYEKIGVNAPLWQDCYTLVDTAVKQAPLGQVTVKNDLLAGVEVFADPLIVKVCYNLMDNAVRYGGKITTIRFSSVERNGEHIFVCEDDGVGVPTDEKERIFDRGFGKNTGLGLALSREILSITGITIRETGEPGKGARFEMTVPKGAWRMTGKGD